MGQIITSSGTKPRAEDERDVRAYAFIFLEFIRADITVEPGRTVRCQHQRSLDYSHTVTASWNEPSSASTVIVNQKNTRISFWPRRPLDVLPPRTRFKGSNSYFLTQSPASSELDLQDSCSPAGLPP
jgi:hypothetical protein